MEKELRNRIIINILFSCVSGGFASYIVIRNGWPFDIIAVSMLLIISFDSFMNGMFEFHEDRRNREIDITE